MNSSNSNSETGPEVGSGTTSLSPGQQLARAREAAGLAREELATRLCMTTSKLELLEQDEYERLAGATYVRGYIRNVCKELKLDAASILEVFDSQRPPEPEQPALPPRGPVVGGSRSQASGGIGFAPVALLALVAAGGGYWWFQGDTALPVLTRSSQPEPVIQQPEPVLQPEQSVPAQTPQLSEQIAVTDGAELAPAEVTQEDVEVEQVADTVEPEAAPVLTAEEPVAPEESIVEAPSTGSGEVAAVAQTPVSGPEAAVALAFAEEAWVEVTDANGDKLLSKLQPAGSRVELTGEAPFQLMLGNAAATTVSYRGEVVDSSPLGNRRTRKLTVGG